MFWRPLWLMLHSRRCALRSIVKENTKKKRKKEKQDSDLLIYMILIFCMKYLWILHKMSNYMMVLQCNCIIISLLLALLVSVCVEKVQTPLQFFVYARCVVTSNVQQKYEKEKKSRIQVGSLLICRKYLWIIKTKFIWVVLW